MSHGLEDRKIPLTRKCRHLIKKNLLKRTGVLLDSARMIECIGRDLEDFIRHLFENILYIRLTEAAMEVSGEKVIDKFFLLFLEFQDFLLDGISDDELLDEDGFRLTHTVCSIGCLIFDGRIPPGIHMDHIVGSGEIESHTSCLQTDEKYGYASRIKMFDEPLAFLAFRLTIEIVIGNLFLIQDSSDMREKSRELTEDEERMSRYEHLLDILFDILELHRLSYMIPTHRDELWHEARLSELQEGIEDDELTLRESMFCELFGNLRSIGSLEIVIESFLFTSHLEVDDLFLLWGEIFQDEFLGSSEDKWLYFPRELDEIRDISLHIAITETCFMAEKSWHQELKNTQ